MKRCFAYIVVTLALLTVPSALGKTCTPKDATAADALVDHLDSWEKVNETLTRYGHCDDGQIAEGNSESIARLLVDHWKLLPELAAMIEHNPALRSLVLRHVDTTLNTGDLDRIKTLATSSCPPGMDSLCRELANAASESAASQAKQSATQKQ